VEVRHNAELQQHLGDEISLASGHTARKDEHVMFEACRATSSQDLARVVRDTQVTRNRASDCHLGRQHRSVAVSDAAWTRHLRRLHEFITGGENCNGRPGKEERPGSAHTGQQAKFLRPKQLTLL
jgi:hypothetical protein